MRIQAAASLVIGLFLLLGCKSSSPEVGLGFDSRHADELAHAALIGTDDIPGTAWRIRDDNFSGENRYKDISECSDLQSGMEQESKLRIARAARTFTSILSTTLLVEIDVYESSNAAERVFDLERSDDVDESGRACFAALIRKSAPAQEFSISISPATAKPRPGVVSFAINVDTSPETENLRFELYRWLLGNAVISLTTRGEKDAFTGDLLNMALDRQVAAAIKVAEGKPR